MMGLVWRRVSGAGLWPASTSEIVKLRTSNMGQGGFFARFMPEKRAIARPAPSPGSGNRSRNAPPSIHERKRARKSFAYCTTLGTRTNRGRKTACAPPVRGRFTWKTPAERTDRPTGIVRVTHHLRYTNENLGENRSCIAPASMRERFSQALIALTTQALLTRVNSGVESGPEPWKSGVRRQFGGRKHEAVSIWVPRLRFRLSN